MGLSRRKFTKELKLAAIQQLDKGSSAAEVARAFEINPNLLHRWRKEFRHGPGNAFSGRRESGAGRNRGLPNWSAKWASKPWRSIF